MLQLVLVVTPLLVMSGVVLRKEILQTPGQFWGGVAGVCLVSVLLYRLYYHVLAWHENSRLPLRLTGLLTGIGVGMLLFASVIAVLSLLGVAHLAVAADYEGANEALALALVSGVVEEIVVRGVIFRNLEAFLGTWIAMALSAALFGWLHASNPHATLASSVAIGLQAGVLLAAAYVATRSLWTPIGIHFAWNFTQGGVFGVPISGVEATASSPRP
jgi:membrane protease YdiL (CAAX protease family)